MYTRLSAASGPFSDLARTRLGSRVHTLISLREARCGLHLFDLQSMPQSVATKQEQPLVTVEISKSRVRLEMTAQVALR